MAVRSLRGAAAILAFGFARGGVDAQIVRDGTLGEGSSPLNGAHVRVSADHGRLIGRNLFHSFATFDVPRDTSVTFSGPAEVRNVLARVTGGAPSHIDGTVGCAIPGADVYLINPAGFLFGPGARLEVSGGFAVTTADVVDFSDGGRFPASPAAPAVLTVAAPAAFRFAARNPSAIVVRGTSASDAFLTPGSPRLSTGTGGSLSFVAGQVRIVGGELRSQNGGVNLVAAGGPSSVPVSVTAGEDPSAESSHRPTRARVEARGTLITDTDRTIRDGSDVLIRSDGDVVLGGVDFASGGPLGTFDVQAGRDVRIGGSRLSGGANDQLESRLEIRAGRSAAIERSTVVGSGGGVTSRVSVRLRAPYARLRQAQLVVSELGGDLQASIDATLLESVNSTVGTFFRGDGRTDGDVNAILADVGQSLARLPDAVATPAAAIHEACATRLAVPMSSFIITGRGGVSLRPDGWQASVVPTPGPITRGTGSATREPRIEPPITKRPTN